VSTAGVVSFVGAGSTNITVTTQDGNKTASCQVTVAAVSGTTGPLTWSLDGGTLTISGTGAMPNYSYATSPWYGYRGNITAVNIEGGVTTIGSHAFTYCSGLTSVTLPNSLTSIGDEAFYGCGNLTSVVIPNSVTNIGYNVFYGCGNLASATLPSSITNLRERIFYQCGALKIVEVGWNTPPNAVWDPGTSAEYSIFDGLSSGSVWNFPFANCLLIVPPGSKERYQDSLPEFWIRKG
jgi:hypothetical protein